MTERDRQQERDEEIKDLGGRVEDRAVRAGDAFERHPYRSGFKWLVILVCIVVVIGVVGAVGKFALGWFNAGAEIVGPTNTKLQYTTIIGDYEALKAEAANACGAETAKESPNGPTLLEDPAFAYKAKYRETAVDYNRRMNNLFEGGIVAPGGYPKYAPSLEEMQERVC